MKITEHPQPADMAFNNYLVITFMLVLTSQLVLAQYRAYPHLCRNNWCFDISDMDGIMSKRPERPEVIVAPGTVSDDVVEVSDVNLPSNDIKPHDEYSKISKRILIAAAALIVTLAVAEPPPSNSYLPPSTRAGGYPQSGQNSLPQVVAARSQGQGFRRSDHGALGHGANGFARNGVQTGHASGPHQAAGRAINQFNSQGYESAGLGRNALEDGKSEPANYNFGYMVNDQHEGTDFGHHEERQEERAQGEYHVVLPDGRKQTVSYEADERGFKPQISYEDSEDLTRSGYDTNANNFRSGQENHGYQNQHGYDNQHGYHDNENGGRSQNGAFSRAGGYN